MPRTVEGEEKYFLECKEKQVLPYTVLSLEYDAKHKTCVAQSIKYATPQRDITMAVHRVVSERIVRGGKIHQIRLEIEGIADTETLQHIVEDMLPDFAVQKYVLRHGDLWLTRYRMCPDAYGRGTALSLQSPTPLEMRLELASPISEREKEKLVGLGG